MAGIVVLVTIAIIIPLLSQKCTRVVLYRGQILGLIPDNTVTTITITTITDETVSMGKRVAIMVALVLWWRSLPNTLWSQRLRLMSWSWMNGPLVNDRIIIR